MKQIRVHKHEYIKEVVLSFYGMKDSHKFGSSRELEYREPRFFAMYFMWKYCKGSLSLIGSKFNKQSHGAVINARDTIKDLIQTDQRMMETFNQLDIIFRDSLPVYDKVIALQDVEDLLNRIESKLIQIKLMNKELMETD